MADDIANDDNISDSPTEWVAEHIRNYVAMDGQEGQKWPGVDTLLLTTTGRKSGKRRRTALIYGMDGNNYIIVASKGGHPHPPAWYLNLLDSPTVELQVGVDKFAATARTATAEEKSRLWPIMTAIWPNYDLYQANTERVIPIVILTRNA